jgi:hypothetical protein
MSTAELALAELQAPFADSAVVHLNNASVSPLSSRAERAIVDVAGVRRDGCGCGCHDLFVAVSDIAQLGCF